MANWRKTVDIKPLLTEDEHDVGAMRAVADKLRLHPEFARVIPYLELAAEQDDCDGFNNALNRAYDIADRERIWLGLLACPATTEQRRQ